VVGDRLSSTYFTENKRPFHNFGNSIVRFLINALFHGEIKDIMTGYRAFSFRFIKTFPVLSRGFEIETEMSIHAIDKNMQVENVVVEYRDRQAGSESKLNTYSDGFKVLRTIVRLYKNYHPFGFFGAIGVFLFLLAFGFAVPVFVDFARTGLVERFPTLIVCGFVALAGIITFLGGIILSSLRQKEKQEFERDLIRIRSLAEE
ncbi:MAG: glycosyl transferase, partial [Lachnospiraceae bacterium]|nr:glycosyl transferase [Lachnospiraceae bacterium]